MNHQHDAKGNAPATDLEIGNRLRKFLETIGMSQTEAGRRAGVTRENMANYITGRVSLPMSVFRRLYARFMISGRWLATGAGSMEDRHRILIPSSENSSAFGLPLDGNFLEGYESHLRALHEDHFHAAENQRAGALATLERFVREAREGEMESSAIITVADEAVRVWSVLPNAKEPAPRSPGHPLNNLPECPEE